MNKSIKYIIAIIAISFFIYNLYSKSQKQNYSGVINPTITQTTSSTSASITLPSLDPNAKCHAQYINKSDPQAVLPDQACTPGLANSAVTQDNIQSTICVSGYTKTIRPKASYTSSLKRDQITQYGFSDTNSRDYEEDHLISLELGGSPDSPQNLWPEPHAAPNEKDKVENYLHQQICSGSISLLDAQKEISTNWYIVYTKLAP